MEVCRKLNIGRIAAKAAINFIGVCKVIAVVTGLMPSGLPILIAFMESDGSISL
jgi:hypothetical protein